MRKTLYTIGYQPIDLVDVDFVVKDIINIVTSNKKPEDIKSLRSEIISFIEANKKELFDNYCLLNSKTNTTFIPYMISRKSILFDPSYTPYSGQVSHLLGQIQKVIGVNSTMNREEISTTAGALNNSLNRVRDLMSKSKVMMSPADYFNALMLLSDLHQCEVQKLQNYILGSSFMYDTTKSYKHIAYFGDPVNPAFFNKLYEKGYIVDAYLPYEQYLFPADELGKYYCENFIFQNPAFKALTLRSNVLNNKNLDFVILGVGSIYLTREEAEYYTKSLKDDATFKIITSYNPTIEELGI